MAMLQVLLPVALLDWQDIVGLRPDDMQGQLMLETLVTACSWLGTGLFASLADAALRADAAHPGGPARLRAADQGYGGGACRMRFGQLLQLAIWKAAAGLHWPSSLRAGTGTAPMPTLAARAAGDVALAANTGVVLTNVLPSNPCAWISEQGWRMGRFVRFASSLALWRGLVVAVRSPSSMCMWRLEQYAAPQLQRRAQQRACARSAPWSATTRAVAAATP